MVAVDVFAIEYNIVQTVNGIGSHFQNIAVHIVRSVEREIHLVVTSSCIAAESVCPNEICFIIDG